MARDELPADVATGLKSSETVRSKDPSSFPVGGMRVKSPREEALRFGASCALVDDGLEQVITNMSEPVEVVTEMSVSEVCCG